MTTTIKAHQPMTAQEKQQRAIQRAQINGGAACATEVRPNTFRVTGRCGDRYTIRTDGSDFQCDCQAGLNGCPCWHAAAVWLRLVAEDRLPKPATCRECGREMAHQTATGCCPKCDLWGG